MKASNNAINLIKVSETVKLKAYKCPAGVPTIGWGHTKGVKMGQIITIQEATKMLYEDVLVCENAVNRLVKVKLSQGRFDALVDFVFNLGSGNLASSTLLKLINKNPNDPAIKAQFMRWVHSGSQVLGGLVIRREKEVELYFS